MSWVSTVPVTLSGSYSSIEVSCQLSIQQQQCDPDLQKLFPQKQVQRKVHIICELETTNFSCDTVAWELMLYHFIISYSTLQDQCHQLSYNYTILSYCTFSPVILCAMSEAKLFCVIFRWYSSTLRLIITFQVVVNLIWRSLHYHYCQYYFLI